MNPNDKYRDNILRFLHERHKKARGISKIPIGIREIQAEMKRRHKMNQSDVISNIDYLIQVGWVKEVVKERSFKTHGGMELSREQIKYKISDLGINHLEAGTIFHKKQDQRHVNITNIQGVTILGDGNIVNTEFTDLSRALDELETLITASATLDDEKKLDALGDISTIKTQIAKKHPSRDIIKSAWKSLETLATLEGASSAFQKVGNFLSSILT